MRAITLPSFGGPDVLTLADIPVPPMGQEDVLIEVAAAGLNNADINQRQGTYPLPPGAHNWPGLELSGIVLCVGESVSLWNVGDRVCALVTGGGYAERAVVNQALILPVPDCIELVDAAGIPEAVSTVWANVFMAAGLAASQTLLVHGGTSGIGSMAIQLATAWGCTVFATAGSTKKVAFCNALGARGINYRDEDFTDVIAVETAGGVDVILDIVGGDYLGRNIAALATNGTLMIIANQSGAAGEFDVNALMRKRGRIWATTLRARPLAERIEIIASVTEHVLPLLESGVVKPIIDTILPLERAADAHRQMEKAKHMGKILLSVS